jgi:hypothetical protein
MRQPGKLSNDQVRAKRCYRRASLHSERCGRKAARSHRLEIRRAEQFAIARHLRCDEAGELFLRLGDGLDPEISQPSARQVTGSFFGGGIEPANDVVRQTARGLHTPYHDANSSPGMPLSADVRIR